MSTVAIPQTPTTAWIVNPAQATKPPALYQGFDGQYIDGSWRPGKHGGVQVDTDPYSGATLAETVMANQGDLDAKQGARVSKPSLNGNLCMP